MFDTRIANCSVWNEECILAAAGDLRLPAAGVDSPVLQHLQSPGGQEP